MKAQGIKGQSSVSPGSQSSKAQSKTSFNQVFKEKVQTHQGAKVSQARNIPVKEQLSKMLEGHPKARDVVATALKENPAFKLLPADVQKDMVRQISEQMEPLIKNRT